MAKRWKTKEIQVFGMVPTLLNLAVQTIQSGHNATNIHSMFYYQKHHQLLENRSEIVTKTKFQTSHISFIVDNENCTRHTLLRFLMRHCKYHISLPVGSGDNGIDTMTTHQRGNHVVTQQRGRNSVVDKFKCSETSSLVVWSCFSVVTAL